MRIKRPSVYKNYIYNLLYQVLGIAVPLITTPYVSRVLQADGLGVASYTGTIATVFTLLAALGFNQYGQREVAYVQDNCEQCSKIFWELCIARIVSTVLCTGLYILVCFLYQSYTVYLLLNVFTLLTVMVDISWFFQGIEHFGIVVTKNAVIKLVSAVLVFCFVKEKADIGIYICINVLSGFCSNAVLWMNLKGYIIPVGWRALEVKRHIRPSIEFFLPLIATQIYSQLDKICLGVLTGNETEIGYYEQARKIDNLIVAIVTAFNGVMYSRIANLYAKGKTTEIKRSYQFSYRILIMILAPVVVGLLLVSDRFVPVFFGFGYAPVSILLKISTILLIFMCVGNYVGVLYLAPMGFQNKMTVIYGTAAVVNLCFNLILIPRFYANGALIASVIAEAVSCVWQVKLFRKGKYTISLLRGIWRYVFSASAMGVVIVYVGKNVAANELIVLLLQICAGVCAYFSLLLCVKDEIILSAIKAMKGKIQGRS